MPFRYLGGNHYYKQIQSNSHDSFNFHQTQAHKHKAYISITRTDWLSMCGWKALLNKSLISKTSWNPDQLCEINQKPQSNTIETNNLCNFTILSMYFQHNFSAISVVQVKKKCADFIIWYTSTHITSQSHDDLRKPITKSIVILFYFYSEIGNDWSKLPGCLYLAFTC